MNFLQMGETWVDMDKVYAVRRENHRDYLETQPRIVYMLRLTGEEQHIAIHETDAAPLLAWLEAHKMQTVLSDLPPGFPELTQEQVEEIAAALQVFKSTGSWELLKK